MDLKCNICNLPYKLLDGVYICAEGHISQHFYEEIDIITTQGQLKKSEKKVKQYTTHRKYLLVFTKLYLLHKKEYQIANDTVLKIYLSYVKEDSTDLFTYVFLLAILYYQLRSERELKNQALFFLDFQNQFNFAKHMITLKNLCHEYRLESKNVRSLNILQCKWIEINKIEPYLEFLGAPHMRGRMFGYFVTDNSFFNENNKRIFREMVRKNDFITVYYDLLVSSFGFAPCEEMRSFFIKYVYYYLPLNTVFVPERIILHFLYIYIKNIKIKMNIDFDKMEKYVKYSRRCFDNFDGRVDEMNRVLNIQELDDLQLVIIPSIDNSIKKDDKEYRKTLKSQKNEVKENKNNKKYIPVVDKFIKDIVAKAIAKIANTENDSNSNRKNLNFNNDEAEINKKSIPINESNNHKPINITEDKFDSGNWEECKKTKKFKNQILNIKRIFLVYLGCKEFIFDRKIYQQCVFLEILKSKTSFENLFKIYHNKKAKEYEMMLNTFLLNKYKRKQKD